MKPSQKFPRSPQCPDLSVSVSVRVVCGWLQVSVQASGRFEQVFMSKATLEEGILIDGSLPQHLWARYES